MCTLKYYQTGTQGLDAMSFHTAPRWIKIGPKNNPTHHNGAKNQEISMFKTTTEVIFCTSKARRILEACSDDTRPPVAIGVFWAKKTRQSTIVNCWLACLIVGVYKAAKKHPLCGVWKRKLLINTQTDQWISANEIWLYGFMSRIAGQTSFLHL